MGVVVTNAEWLKANAPDYGPEAGELDWGPGNVPPGLEDEPPSKGGAYRGTTPPAEEPSGLRALADELAERRARGAS
ncbi:hypothetical protein VZC37_01450 [Gordonia sp. LSe1-13]|uniref:Uncharacterized protein n=1 Tax=Gordonia sesuvii TaxID=3116777 RepID=A0ABU7M798_9ACTN|nr:hypothetical protein [Gordonia sp. LSe1-13]